MSTRRLAESVAGLNSSLALAAGDLWPKNARSLKGDGRGLQTMTRRPNAGFEAILSIMKKFLTEWLCGQICFINKCFLKNVLMW